jgi:hypothetical protein
MHVGYRCRLSSAFSILVLKLYHPDPSRNHLWVGPTALLATASPNVDVLQPRTPTWSDPPAFPHEPLRQRIDRSPRPCHRHPSVQQAGQGSPPPGDRSSCLPALFIPARVSTMGCSVVAYGHSFDPLAQRCRACVPCASRLKTSMVDCCQSWEVPSCHGETKLSLGRQRVRVYPRVNKAFRVVATTRTRRRDEDIADW